MSLRKEARSWTDAPPAVLPLLLPSRTAEWLPAPLHLRRQYRLHRGRRRCRQIPDGRSSTVPWIRFASGSHSLPALRFGRLSRAVLSSGVARRNTRQRLPLPSPPKDSRAASLSRREFLHRLRNLLPDNPERAGSASPQRSRHDLRRNPRHPLLLDNRIFVVLPRACHLNRRPSSHHSGNLGPVQFPIARTFGAFHSRPRSSHRFSSQPRFPVKLRHSPRRLHNAAAGQVEAEMARMVIQAVPASEPSRKAQNEFHKYLAAQRWLVSVATGSLDAGLPSQPRWISTARTLF